MLDNAIAIIVRSFFYFHFGTNNSNFQIFIFEILNTTELCEEIEPVISSYTFMTYVNKELLCVSNVWFVLKSGLINRRTMAGIKLL